MLRLPDHLLPAFAYPRYKSKKVAVVDFDKELHWYATAPCSNPLPTIPSVESPNPSR